MGHTRKNPSAKTFNDITVKLEKITNDDGTSESDGLTPPELAVTLDKDNGDALLVVACSDTMAAS